MPTRDLGTTTADQQTRPSIFPQRGVWGRWGMKKVVCTQTLKGKTVSTRDLGITNKKKERKYEKRSCDKTPK